MRISALPLLGCSDRWPDSFSFVFRRRRRSELQIDVESLDPTWRAPVHEALASRARFVELLETVRDGPVRARLAGIAEDIDRGVVAVFDTARRTQAAERIVAELDPARVSDELKEARRRLGTLERDLVADRTSLESVIEDLAARHRSIHRTLNGVEQARERLRVLNVRLSAAVAQAVEVVLAPAADDDVERIDGELRAVVAELGALGAALDELSR